MLISIIVPVYNVENYISECVNSIINQTYTNLEIILVNDGSTDKSGQICDSFSKKDHRIKVIHTSNKGLSAARNEGVRNSSGDYIMFIDGDDFITNTAVADIVKIINDENDVEIITGKMILYYNEKKQFKEEFVFSKNKFKNKSGIEVLNYFFSEVPTYMWSACRSIYKKKILLDNELYFSEGITSEDLDLVPRIYMHAQKVAPYDEPFYYYRQLRPNSIINTINVKKFYDIVIIIEKYVSEIQHNKQFEKIKNSFLMQLANIYIRYIAILSEVPKNERKKVKSELKRLKYLLKYASGLRGLFISKLIKIFGFEITSTLYLSIKHLSLLLRNNR